MFLSFKRLLTSNSNKFIPFDCAQANWRHNDLHIECVFMHRKYETIFVFSFFYTKVMYQDRNVHEIPKRKTYFFEVLLKCICSAAFMPRCLLFQTFDANRSWISKRFLCCFTVCVCSLDRCLCLLFCLVYICSFYLNHILWERKTDIFSVSMQIYIQIENPNSDYVRIEIRCILSKSKPFYRNQSHLFSLIKNLH